MEKRINVSKAYHLIQEQEELLKTKTKQSEDTFKNAKEYLVGGVASGYHSSIIINNYISLL